MTQGARSRTWVRRRLFRLRCLCRAAPPARPSTSLSRASGRPAGTPSPCATGSRGPISLDGGRSGAPWHGVEESGGTMMDALIAHGGEASRRGLATALQPLGLRISEAADGADALEAMLAEEVPRIALVDWDLPRIEGPELCRLVRDFHVEDPPYVILLAGAAHSHEVPAGLQAGAHDCVRTPVGATELRARVEMGRRFMELPWGRPSPGCRGSARRGAPQGRRGAAARRRTVARPARAQRARRRHPRRGRARARQPALRPAGGRRGAARGRAPCQGARSGLTTWSAGWTARSSSSSCPR